MTSLTLPALSVLGAEVEPGQALAGVLLYVVVGLVLSAGVGAALATLRVILPGLAASADRSLASGGGRRLFLMGVLPLLGAAVLLQAAAALGSPVAHGIVLLAVVVPVVLALLIGTMAALPHLGERLLERGNPRSPLARAAGGGVVVGLAATTVWVPPLFALVALLLGGWFLGIGLGAVLGRRPPVG